MLAHAVRQTTKQKVKEPVTVTFGNSSSGEKCVKANASCEFDATGEAGIGISFKKGGLVCAFNYQEYGKGWSKALSATCEKGFPKMSYDEGKEDWWGDELDPGSDPGKPAGPSIWDPDYNWSGLIQTHVTKSTEKKLDFIGLSMEMAVTTKMQLM